MNLFTKRNRVTDVEKQHCYEGGMGGEGKNWEIGTDVYPITTGRDNKDLLYSKGKSTSNTVLAYMGK